MSRTKLALQVARYKHVFEHVPDALVLVDDRARITEVNAQFERMFGYRRDEVIGESVELLIPQRYRIHHRTGNLDEPHDRPWDAGLGLYGVRKDGTEFPVDTRLSTFESEGQSLTAAAIRDVTESHVIVRAIEEKNAELEQANKAKDTFLTSMSHELRTPLSAILGFAGTLLMEKPGPLNGVQRHQLETIRSSAVHLLSLINGLLDLAKIESGDVDIELREVTCQDLLDEVASSLKPLADEKGLELRVEEPSEMIIVKSDKRALNQILINLTSNAIKFTDDGAVALSVHADRKKGVTEFRVADTGPGISKDDHERIFAAFERGSLGDDREGNGLGLYISRRLADVIGADLSVESELGKGASFCVGIRNAA